MASPAPAGRREWTGIVACSVLALVVLTNGRRSLAQNGQNWVGERVVTKFGAVLRVGRRIVDDERIENTASGGLRNLSRIYVIKQVSGHWLWIQDEKSGAAGWVSTEWVIPYDQAIEYFTDEIAVSPYNPAAYNSRGHIWRDKKEYDLAIADYSEAIRLDPANEVGWCSRGLAWIGKKEFDRALADFGTAIRLDRRYAPAYYNRGIAWFEKREYDKAIADYGAAIRLDRRYTLAYNNRGFAWLVKKEFDKAIADFDQAIRLDHKDVFAYINRSAAQMILRQGDAMAGFKTVIKLEGGNGELSPYAVILGHLAARLAHDATEARAFLERARGKVDADSWPYPVVELFRGEIDEPALLAAATDDDLRTGARCYLGLAHELKDDKEQALDHFRWVRDHGNPGFVEYWIAVAELERLEKPEATALHRGD